MKQEIVPNEQNEVIPRRDIRAVEAIARSGRKLRPLTKPGNLRNIMCRVIHANLIFVFDWFTVICFLILAFTLL